MNTFKGCWPQFKRELPALIYIFIAQFYLIFNFPFFIMLGSLLGFIAKALANIAAMSVYISIFIFPERYVSLLKINPFAKSSNVFLRASLMLGPYYMVALLAWYMDFYGMSNMGYALFHMHTSMVFFLMYRAVQRYQSSKEEIGVIKSR